MSVDDFPIGTRVTYDDEPIDNPAIRGTVILPTDDDLENAKTWGYPPGPEHGDLLVQWDDGVGSWEHCTDLQKLPEPRRFVKGWRS